VGESVSIQVYGGESVDHFTVVEMRVFWRGHSPRVTVLAKRSDGSRSSMFMIDTETYERLIADVIERREGNRQLRRDITIRKKKNIYVAKNAWIAGHLLKQDDKTLSRMDIKSDQIV
jgi:hypothetical protein